MSIAATSRTRILQTGPLGTEATTARMLVLLVRIAVVAAGFTLLSFRGESSGSGAIPLLMAILIGAGVGAAVGTVLPFAALLHDIWKGTAGPVTGQDSVARW